MSDVAGSPQELRRRDAILHAARFATERFVDAAGDWRRELPAVLAAFGEAAEVSRVFVSANLVDAEGRLCSRPLAEWDAPGIARVGDDPQLQAAPPWSDGFARWAQLLGRGETIAGAVREFPASEQALFLPQGVVSTVVVPVHVEGEWWGHVGFDECSRERTWSDDEQAALRTAAAILGFAVRLERATAALRERETQYEEVFRAGTDGMAILGLDGVLVRANPAFHAMHGYAPGELDGRSAEVWTAEGRLPEVVAYVRQHWGDRSHRLRTLHRRKDGTPFPVEVSGSEIHFGGEPHLLGVVHDVTEREEAMALLERRVSALGRVAACLVVDQPLAQTLREVVRIVVQAGSGVAAALHLVDQATRELTLLASHGLPEGYEEGLRASWALGADLPATEALRDRSVHLVHGSPALRAADPLAAPLHPYLPEATWDAVLSLSLDSLGRSLGALHVYRPPGPDPLPDELTFLSAVADQTAVAIENARLLDDGRRNAALLERQRLARDLHDSVSQALFSMTLHARTAQLAMAALELPADGRLGRSVGQLRELTQGALAEMRALIFELRPGALAEEGLVAAVGKQAAAIGAREALPITVTGPAERLAVPAETEEHLYRIVLEALHNAVKHARAEGVTVTVTDGEHVAVVVRDDGRGFDPTAEHPGHLGLGTMRDRAAAIGAVLTLDSAPGRGTRVAIRVPIGGRS